MTPEILEPSPTNWPAVTIPVAFRFVTSAWTEVLVPLSLKPIISTTSPAAAATSRVNCVGGFSVKSDWFSLTPFRYTSRNPASNCPFVMLKTDCVEVTLKVSLRISLLLPPPPPAMLISTVFPTCLMLLPAPTKFRVLTVPIAEPAEWIATTGSLSSMVTGPTLPWNEVTSLLTGEANPISVSYTHLTLPTKA